MYIMHVTIVHIQYYILYRNFSQKLEEHLTFLKKYTKFEQLYFIKNDQNLNLKKGFENLNFLFLKDHFF